MCDVDVWYRKPIKKVQYAWKSISKYSTSDIWYPWALGGVYKRGKWIQARDKEHGFNVFTKRSHAKDGCGEIVLKVRVRGIEGEGEFCGYKILFAREIFVPLGRK